MSRLDLPDGQWAELVNPRKVSERKRRPYIAAMTDLSSSTADIAQIPNPQFGGEPGQPVTIPDPARFSGAHMQLADRVSDALILALVAEWSFGDVSQDILEGLPADCFDPIFRACRDLAPELAPDYGPDPDPKAPEAKPGRLPPGSPAARSTYATLSSDGTS